MRAQVALIGAVACLLALMGAFCVLQEASGDLVEGEDAQRGDTAPTVLEAEACLLTPTETCWTEGAWITWSLPTASGGMLIDNENPPGSGIPVSGTLTLRDVKGTGVGVVYRQDIWYGTLGLRIDPQPESCIKERGETRDQAEACFELDGTEPTTLTLFLTGTEQTDIITGVITLDAIKIYDTDEPCGGESTLCDRGLVVPAYLSDTQVMTVTPASGYWERLAEAARRLGDRLVVIANVHNGPGKAYRPDYAKVLSAIASRGGRVVGYVYTCAGNEAHPIRPHCPRPEGDIEADIRAWYEWYGSAGISGIFFDEVALTQDKAGFYEKLHQIVQEQEDGATVVFSTGGEPDEEYARIGAEILCAFEGPSRCFEGWLAPGWLPRARSCAFVTETDPDLGPALAPVSRKDLGWIYVTTDTDGVGNPYDTLPDYFEKLVNRLSCTYLPAVFSEGTDGRCQVSIRPSTPADTDSIEVTVSGIWPDSCVPEYGSHQIVDHLVRIDLVHDYPPGTMCLEVLTPWEYLVELGTLASGSYQVQAYIEGVPCGATSFVVGSR